MSEQTPANRLNYTGSLDPIIDGLSEAYGIGRPTDFSMVEVGYEDCNVLVHTEQGKFLAKMFAKTRTADEIVRYTRTIQKVVEAGVNHPELRTTSSGATIYSKAGVSMVLMQFIEGETFFELDRAPDAEERRAVIEQASRVNTINYKPEYILDSWAIVNIKAMLDRVKEFVEPDDLVLAEQVVSRFNSIPLEILPHCFVHGDLTKANVMKADDGEIYIFDFSVANWYPRIQELAVIVANLLHDGNSDAPLEAVCQQVADEYCQSSPLTNEERKYLPDYTLAGIAMEFLGAHQEKYINGIDNEENNYWMSLGREGLKKALL